MWLLCYGILILSLGTVPMNMGWMMGLFIGGGKTVVEIMVFAIATDVSDDEMRYVTISFSPKPTWPAFSCPPYLLDTFDDQS